MKNVTPQKIESLKDNEIFVFGSNEAGIHGKGAALYAYQKFGAVRGQEFGLQGKSFAIPTKDKKLNTLTIDKVKEYVDAFIFCAKGMKNHVFLVTKVGCGLAGFSVKEIAPLFKECKDLSNVYLPSCFWYEIGQLDG